IAFQDYQLTCDNLFYQLSDFENLFVKQAHFNTDFYNIKNISIKTKYSKEALSKQIAVERDYFDLAVDSIIIRDNDLGIKNDSSFYFKSRQVDFYQPKLNIYRDKLVADNLLYKPLYSKLLRGLNFGITLNKVVLKNASIF